MVLPSCVMVIRERRRQYGDFAGKKRNGFPGGLTRIEDMERCFGCWLSFYY